MTVRALIFDVDGTLAETEEIHRAAFNQTFEEAGLGWLWTEEDYRRLLLVTGGRERIAAYAGEIAASGLDIPALHRRKTDLFNDKLRRGPIALRPGVEQLIRVGRERSLQLAIATTTSRPNVASLIEATLGAGAIDWFASVRTGEDVARKKPDPEVYRLALDDLGLSGSDCLAFEDSANGLRAALGAGIPTIVTPSMYTRGEDWTGAMLVLDDLSEFADPGDIIARQIAR
jgi:HAD superfamily hydrolase (TIGR01509 family)